MPVLLFGGEDCILKRRSINAGIETQINPGYCDSKEEYCNELLLLLVEYLHN